MLNVLSAPSFTAPSRPSLNTSAIEATLGGATETYAPGGGTADWAPYKPDSMLLARVSGEQQRDGNHQLTADSRTYPNPSVAQANFRRQSEYLLRPGSWNSHVIGASYQDAPTWTLLNQNGQEDKTNRQLHKGDVMRIGSPTGDYFVKVEETHNQPDNVGFTVRPTSDPNHPAGITTDHFFTEEATRTFNLQRTGNDVRFTTEGCNETLNVAQQSGGVLDGALNAAAGAGIMYGMGDLYWNQFGKQLLNY